MAKMKRTCLIVLLILVLAFAQKIRVEKEGRLGVYSKNLSKPMRIALDVEKEVLVTDIVEDSPAEKGGIEVGDVILKIDGKDVDNQDDLIELVRSQPNQEVVIELLRKGKIKEITLTIGERDKTGPRKFALPQHPLKKAKKCLNEFEPFLKRGVEKCQKELTRLKAEMKELRQELKELKEKLKKLTVWSFPKCSCRVGTTNLSPSLPLHLPFMLTTAHSLKLTSNLSSTLSQSQAL